MNSTDTNVQEFDRHYVYNACLLASSRGKKCWTFGNACSGKHGNGEWKDSFYQKIAAEYGEEADTLGEKECWNLYTSSKYYPYRQSPV